MVYGQDFMVNVPLPKYWQVDMDFAHRNRINGFFFIKEKGIAGSPVGIIMTLAEKPNDESTLDDYILYDKSLLTDHYKDMIFLEKNINKNQENGFNYKIYEFSPAPGGRLQYIAYMDCMQKYFVKIYIDCKTRDGVDQYINDFFDAVVELSYWNVDVKVY